MVTDSLFQDPAPAGSRLRSASMHRWRAMTY
jgi:hypothetical protein